MSKTILELPSEAMVQSFEYIHLFISVNIYQVPIVYIYF